MGYGCRMAAALVLSASVMGGAQVRATHWRGVGATPCVGSDGGVYECPPVARVVAVRAGRMFDSMTGRMLENQVVLILGERITEVGPAGKVKIPSGAEVIDLSRDTVLPGLIDAHTHMFDRRGAKVTTEEEMLIAASNAATDLRAGFTTARDMTSHGNGYGDIAIRDAINGGRIEGPRYQVSTRGVEWADKPAKMGVPDDPFAGELIRSADEGRAAVKEQVSHGADWIKLYPSDGYSFDAKGDAVYPVKYPLPVLEATIEQAHALGKKVGCHVFGGEGLQNAITAHCDTIEHAFGLTQEQADTMAREGIYLDPTFVRYSIPWMDDNDARNTGGRYSMIAIFEKMLRMAVATKGLKIIVGSGVDGSMYPHGKQALDLEALVKRGGMSTAGALEAATSVNAEALGWQDRVGSIGTGKYADLVAVAGDPLADITEMQRVRFVMKAGRVVRYDLAAR